ncbi:FapA family protein [Desulfuribacillus alkaliarsenatis]|uniref:Flagellar Assembly Protein A N-terminal region domain-containing protein n=1 Tax=Desulfuribacillus alkaliarsenatis TaxID=766136 RepID=A0A1E5G4X4_9FIRM|nr:FapA family protein [Desulfuribacillus alkaliarsenatis]OEF98230.1 hypothetical protein BHF68_00660 [Desulfuribacillus alkaliarsenatis]
MRPLDEDKYLEELIKTLNIDDSDVCNRELFENSEMTFETEPENISSITKTVDKDEGTVQIKDGKITVTNPVGNGKYPKIIPTPDIITTVNQARIRAPRTVKESDDITWEINNQIKGFEITVCEEKLHVYFQVTPDIYRKKIIVDSGPSNVIKLESTVIDYDFSPQDIYELIVEEIYKLQIKVDVNTTLILNELWQPSYEKVLIAKGVPVTQSKDSYIETFFSTKIEEVIEEVSGKVDFKNRVKIPSVKQGDIVARLHPPEEGVEGYNVFGRIIRPKHPKKLSVKLNKNVEMKADGTIIALKSGRLSISGNLVKHIDIFDVHIVHGDVDIKKGNIYFTGDVIVYGDVKEDMRIESMGNIWVFGNVFYSTLVSAQSITISGNVINSYVYGGHFITFYSQAYRVLQDLSHYFEKLYEVANQLMTELKIRNQEISYTKVVATLLDGKFNTIIKRIDEYNDIYTEAKRHTNIQMDFMVLYKLLLPYSSYQTTLKLASIESIKTLIFALNEGIEKINNSIKEDSTISTGYSSFSTLKTNGDVVYVGNGSYHSLVFAGKDCKFYSQNSVIRGGTTEAIKDIIASKVGNELGAPPCLTAGRTILAKELISAKIKIKNKSVFYEGQRLRNVKFYYDHNDDVVKYIKN